MIAFINVHSVSRYILIFAVRHLLTVLLPPGSHLRFIGQQLYYTDLDHCTFWALVRYCTARHWPLHKTSAYRFASCYLELQRPHFLRTAFSFLRWIHSLLCRVPLTSIRLLVALFIELVVLSSSFTSTNHITHRCGHSYMDRLLTSPKTLILSNYSSCCWRYFAATPFVDKYWILKRIVL